MNLAITKDLTKILVFVITMSNRKKKKNCDGIPNSLRIFSQDQTRYYIAVIPKLFSSTV